MFLEVYPARRSEQWFVMRRSDVVLVKKCAVLGQLLSLSSNGSSQRSIKTWRILEADKLAHATISWQSDGHNDVERCRLCRIRDRGRGTCLPHFLSANMVIHFSSSSDTQLSKVIQGLCHSRLRYPTHTYGDYNIPAKPCKQLTH